MTIKYKNTKEKTYYLHKGQTKTGNDRYYFSMKTDGSLCNTIPEGYEIYEHPNAQVFLRKIPKKIILDSERDIVEKELREASSLRGYKIDIRKNSIQIYTPDQNIDAIENIMGNILPLSAGTKSAIANIINYSPEMQFILINEENRIFSTQRYNYLSRIDDWMDIGYSGSLSLLVKRYVKHLGKESFFELY
jgi:hypothetical protein